MSAPMANASSGAVLGVLSLFNGFTANRLNMPLWLYWIQYMSPFYWGFVAVSIPLMQTYLHTTTTPAPLLIASGGAGGNLVEEPGNVGDDLVIMDPTARSSSLSSSPSLMFPPPPSPVVDVSSYSYRALADTFDWHPWMEWAGPAALVGWSNH